MLEANTQKWLGKRYGVKVSELPKFLQGLRLQGHSADFFENFTQAYKKQKKP